MGGSRLGIKRIILTDGTGIPSPQSMKQAACFLLEVFESSLLRQFAKHFPRRVFPLSYFLNSPRRRTGL